MNKLTSILLVDDDTTTNFVNQMLLEDLDVTEEVLIACNGKEALETIDQQCQKGNCPQLILLDINMPVMNGFEFLEAYKQLDLSYKQSVMIVMLTTSMNPADMDRLGKMPIRGVLNKPLTAETFKRILGETFSGRPIG